MRNGACDAIVGGVSEGGGSCGGGGGVGAANCTAGGKPKATDGCSMLTSKASEAVGASVILRLRRRASTLVVASPRSAIASGCSP